MTELYLVLTQIEMALLDVVIGRRLLVKFHFFKFNRITSYKLIHVALPTHFEAKTAANWLALFFVLRFCVAHFYKFCILTVK